MLKVVDLDHQGKDADGLIFTLTVAGDKIGITDQEVIELIKGKYATGKGKRAQGRRTSASDSGASDGGGGGDAEANGASSAGLGAESSEASH